MKTFCLSLALVVAGLAALPSHANTFNPPVQYTDERAQFKQAKAALNAGNRTQFKILMRELEHYPLYPYLEYADIATNLRSSSEQRVQRFLSNYENTPVANRLQHQWLEYLRKRGSWKTYLKYYSGGSTAQQCFHAMALYRSGAKAEGLEAALALWNVGKSQPKDCDKLFHVLISSGAVTEAIAWQRYQKASAANNKKLSRYLKRFFKSSAYKTAYANYETIKRQPAKLPQYANFADQSEPNKAVLARAIRLLAKQDAPAAQAQWREVQQHVTFSDKQVQEVETALIKNFIRQDLSQQGDALLENHKQFVSADLLEWRIREALSHSDWSNVRYWINQLPVELATEQRWRYWLARAETAMTPEARLQDHPLIAPLATERGYYSFLAADELQQRYAMNYQPSSISPELVASIENNPAIVRARELYLVGETVNAVREWNAAGDTFDAKQWEAAGLAFYEWGWHHIAIISMVKARAWQDIVVRFPVLHETEYRKYASMHQLDTPLLMAITRQESAFNTQAVSPSNAKGLMQLLPSTAKYIANKVAVPYRSSSELLEAEKNIALGSAYYKYLMEKFDNNRAVSIASYNAGPGRVGKWLEQSGGNTPVDIWVETIPYSETRRYVQNVLTFSVIYAQHLGETAQLYTYNEKQQPL